MTGAEYNAKCATDVMGWRDGGYNSWAEGKQLTAYAIEDRGQPSYFDPANNPAHAMMVLDKMATKKNEHGHWSVLRNQPPGNFHVKIFDEKTNRPITGNGRDLPAAARAAICAAEGWG